MSGMLAGLNQYTEFSFWVSVLQIIWINILLSGDNALVIALACRSLPPKQRLGGMVIGTAVALALRLLFASIVSTLMLFPYIKIAGGIALLWIAVKLLMPNSTSEQEHSHSADNLWRAVKIIALADVVMSLDNVIAVAGAADGNYALLVFGLGISIPAIVAGATLFVTLLTHFPFLVWAGAALLGWIAGDVIATDPALADNTETVSESAHTKMRIAMSTFGVITTIFGGLFFRARQAKESL